MPLPYPTTRPNRSQVLDGEGSGFAVRRVMPALYTNKRKIPMQFINRNIKWVMLVSGLLTCTVVLAVISPELALKNTFGASIQGPLAEVVVRSWGALITLVGAMLIYGAYRPVHRNLVLVVATLSKLVFVGLVVTVGNQFLGKAGLTIAFDSVVAIIFVLYLVSPKNKLVGV